MLYEYAKHRPILASSLPPYESQSELNSSTSRLYRYNHEPVSANLLSRDISSILMLLFFLLLLVISLSQILVVHTSRYGANLSAMQKIQDELKLMDQSMEAILRDNVLPIDKWRLLFQIQSYLYRFEFLFDSFRNVSYTLETEQTNKEFNDIRDNISVNQLLKPLLNKSNELLLQQNNSEYLIKHIKRVQNHLTSLISKENTEHNPLEFEELNQNHRNGNVHGWEKNYCHEEPRNLRGRFLNENSSFPNVSLYEIETNYTNVRSGGEWSPPHCIARHRDFYDRD